MGRCANRAAEIEANAAIVANTTGVDAMRYRRFIVALSATILFTAASAWACPSGYIACGERHQLCCPAR